MLILFSTATFLQQFLILLNIVKYKGTKKAAFAALKMVLPGEFESPSPP